MERNTKTTIYHLHPGDRFYKCTDKNKTVYQKIEHEEKKTAYQTYSHWAIEAKHFGRVLTREMIDTLAKPINSNTEVIYLRTVNE